MSIGTITAGTVAEATGTDQSVTPAIPGASSSADVLIVVFQSRGALTSVTETGAGDWTLIHSDLATRAQAAWWAPGTETNAPVLASVGTQLIAAVVIRIVGGSTTPVGGVGAQYTSGGNDNSAGPITVPTLASTDGVVFCHGNQIDTLNSVAASVVISANSTVSWVNTKNHFTTTGSDMSWSIFHGLYTTAPTLASETITWTGGTPGAGQSGIMFEIKAAPAGTGSGLGVWAGLPWYPVR